MDNAQQIVFLYRAASVPDLILEKMRAAVPEGFELTLCEQQTPDAERRAHVAGADHLLVYSVGFDDLDVANNVRLVQLLSAGYDKLDVEALGQAGIPVADNGGANAPTVAEHALMLMLAVLRKLPMHHDALQRGEWLGLTRGLGLRELRGRQVGIVGFGRIGRDVARMVKGFLAEPVYADAMPAPAEVEAELGARRLPLDELLATSDIVTLHTPLNDSTRGFINAETLSRMKPGAFLINTSRGPVVDEAALIAALEKGQIAGAGLDVFQVEPIGADHPLLHMDNVVMTPHTAGTTIDTWTRRIEFGLGNIARVASGEPALSVVNHTSGAASS
jgi:phosphoglycerate dehydrogenase-like enzyme